MADRDNMDSVRLNDAAARRLLERATELDARLASESTVADLRDAARAAGISEEAFQRALAEVREDAQPKPPAMPAPSNPSSRLKLAVGLAAILLLGAGVMFFRAAVFIPNREAPAAQRIEAVPAAPVPTPAPAPVVKTKTKTQR